MRRTVFLLVAVAMLCTPRASAAAELSLRHLRTTPEIPGDGRYYPTVPQDDVYAVRIADGAGEANDIQLDARGRLRDDGAPLRPSAGCSVDGEGWATCTATPRPGMTVSYVLEIEAGDGRDRVRITGPQTFRGSPLTSGTVDLGGGDDGVEVLQFRASVTGGPGADSVTASAQGNPDSRPGIRSVITPVVWDGGPGPDRSAGDAVTVTYAPRTAAVRVTPDGIADDGEPGEADDVGADVAAIVGGSGGDELHSPGWAVDGGPGDDRVIGAPGERPGRRYVTEPNETLFGGPGDDVLRGGTGREDLEDGPGRDVIDGEAGDDVARPEADGAPDVWAGGEGRDWLFYGHDEMPVRVSVDSRANDGALSEGDDVRPGWERIDLRRGELVGSEAGEELRVLGDGSIDGRGGDDVLSGAATLIGGPGRDALQNAGSENAGHRSTRIDVRDGEPDRVLCTYAISPVRLRRDPIDRVRRCFRRAYDRDRTPRRPLRSGAPLGFAIRCPNYQRCRGRLTVRAGQPSGPVVGTAPFSIAPRRTARVVVRLARAAALRRSCGRASLKVKTHSPWTRGEAEGVTHQRELAPPSRGLAACRVRRGQKTPR